MHLSRHILAFSLIIVAACGATQADEPVVEQPDMGEALYKKYCTLCHGTDGKKGFNGASDLTASKLNLEERILIIKEGRGLMTPYKEILSPLEMKSIAQYTLKLKK